MKAIVLSYDRNHPLVDHTLATYMKHWPSNEFVFRVPYQQRPTWLENKYAGRIEPIETDSSIKGTVLTLVSDLQDDEWVYWAIDDKYIVALDEAFANHCHRWISQQDDPSVQGLLFCRCRRLLGEENLRPAGPDSPDIGERLRERRNYWQFWLHQYMRVGVLRSTFDRFPDFPFVARQMDTFTGQRDGHNVKEFSPDQKMYLSELNHARFGESTTLGRLTRNCRRSMERYELPSPKNIESIDYAAMMGEYPPAAG